MLITKMASFLRFGNLEASKIAYEVWTFGVFRAKGKIPGDGSGQPAAVGWPEPSPGILSLARKTSKVRTSNASYDFQKPQIQKLRPYS